MFRPTEKPDICRTRPRYCSNRHIGPILAAIRFAGDVDLVSPFAGALTVSTWTSWPPSEFVSKRQELTHHRQARSRPDYPTYLTHLEFALMALTVVAPMLFLVDFVAQDLHAGIYIGSLCWAGCGLGAMVGPLAYGYAADRLGAITALRRTFLIHGLWTCSSAELWSRGS